MDLVLLTLGAVALLAALVGGGLRALNVEIPLLESSQQRWALGFVGLIMMGIALAMALRPHSDSESPRRVPQHPEVTSLPQLGTAQEWPPIFNVTWKRIEAPNADCSAPSDAYFRFQIDGETLHWYRSSGGARPVWEHIFEGKARSTPKRGVTFHNNGQTFEVRGGHLFVLRVPDGDPVCEYAPTEFDGSS